jgi:nucleolar protein 53
LGAIVNLFFSHSTYRGKISERSDDKLFIIDVKGDDRVKRQLAKDKPLYIEKILESRSAIPAVGTRLFSLPKSSPKEKGKESKANNAKIDKLVKRKLTQTEPAKPAKKSKGTAYDVWADEGKEPLWKCDMIK